MAQADLRAPKCLTCDEGTDCGYASASFSWSSDYYVLACLGPAVPTYTLKYMHDASQSEQLSLFNLKYSRSDLFLFYLFNSF